MKIVWTDPAVEDLRELHAYIARDSEMYASGFVERIILATERLVDYPKLGRIVSETTDENIRELIFQQYRILSIAFRTILLNCCRSSRVQGIWASSSQLPGTLVDWNGLRA
jgi:plasmid stabilization system protein ParE